MSYHIDETNNIAYHVAYLDFYQPKMSREKEGKALLPL